MAVCISCGNEIAENAKFCNNCGAPKAVEEKTVEEVKVETAVPAAAETETVPPAAPALETEFIPKPLFNEVDNRKTAAYGGAAAPAAPAMPAEPAPAEETDKPRKKSKWDIISTKGYVGINLLMAIPGIGLILTIIWACGGCRKYAKRNYARAALIFMAIGVLLLIAAALVLRFVFADVIVQVFEALYPGYTIIF
ncbi:MAG: zinc ribbon domain-containing protein [Oscillospiraceae bacterium]|nr:zinc ribbon domain-containing protein [Oscillospiraceae bacterium]